MLAGGVDAVLIETSQDLLQAKAATLGASGRWPAPGGDLPVIVNVTVETTGTMLLGSEIGAALTALEPLGIDLIGLNCATGPAEMSEHLRHLSRYAAIGLGCMPNAGLPQLTADGAALPAEAGRAGRRPGAVRRRVRARPGRRLLRHHARSTCARWSSGWQDRASRPRTPAHVPAASRRCTPRCRSGRTPATCPSGSGPTPTAPRRSARRCWQERWDDCVDIARAQIRDGAHLLDLNIDYVGRDGAGRHAGRWPSGWPPPRRCRSCSTRPSRRCCRPAWSASAAAAVINSVNYEDGDGPDSRFAKIMPLVVEHGAAVIALTIDEEGQARTAEWKVRGGRPADRRPDRELGHADRRHHHRLPDLPDRHRPGGDPAGRHRDHRGHPGGQAPLPGRADHAGPVQHLLRAQPGRPGGAELGVPERVHRGRPGLGDRARRQDRADGPDPGRAARGGAGHGLRPAPRRATTRCSASSSCSRASPPPTPRRNGPPSWPRCRSPSGCSGGSSTARARGWPTTSTWPWPTSRRWRSSTPTCWPA